MLCSVDAVLAAAVPLVPDGKNILGAGSSLMLLFYGVCKPQFPPNFLKCVLVFFFKYLTPLLRAILKGSKKSDSIEKMTLFCDLCKKF